MSKKESQKQEKLMAAIFRGKEVFKPINTGWIDDHVSCVREYVANIFFYTKNDRTIMIDAGYNYPRLKEKMEWLGLRPEQITDILITHQDTDHVGAVETGSDGLFAHSKLYISQEENRYLTGERRRKVFWGLYTLPQVTIPNEKQIIDGRQVFSIGDIRVEAFPTPGHTRGHMAYLIDNAYLFTGDAIWLGADGGYSFLNVLAEDNSLGTESLITLKQILMCRDLEPMVITGHTGWTDNFRFAFAHVGKVCHALRKQKPHDPTAPYDGYDEHDDTRERAQSQRLPKAYQAPED